MFTANLHFWAQLSWWITVQLSELLAECVDVVDSTTAVPPILDVFSVFLSRPNSPQTPIQLSLRPSGGVTQGYGHMSDDITCSHGPCIPSCICWTEQSVPTQICAVLFFTFENAVGCNFLLLLWTWKSSWAVFWNSFKYSNSWCPSRLIHLRFPVLQSKKLI